MTTTEHKALTALRVAHQAMAAPTGDQQEWKDILENKALPMVRNAIPALEALIAQNAELRGALDNLLHFTAPATDGIDPVALRRSRAAAIALLAKGDA